jgi:hypothetical protein
MGIFLAIMAGGGANAGPDGKDVPRVAFLGFEFINTIAIPVKPEPSWDTRRINSNTLDKAEISNIFG